MDEAKRCEFLMQVRQRDWRLYAVLESALLVLSQTKLFIRPDADVHKSLLESRKSILDEVASAFLGAGIEVEF